MKPLQRVTAALTAVILITLIISATVWSVNKLIDMSVSHPIVATFVIVGILFILAINADEEKKK